MRLSERVHLVASGAGGVSLTDRFDCNAYLIDGGSEAALVDAGIGAATDALLRNVEAAGVALERLRWLLLTHAHPDHSGGAGALVRRLPQLEVVASPEAARWVSNADDEAISLANGKRADFYPAGFTFEPCPVERTLADGESLRVGDVEVTAVATPGHSAGHLAFVAGVPGGDACFCGDLVFYGGRISLVANWDCSLQDYAASVGRLAAVDFDALLPGHHAVTLHGGHEHVGAALRRFANGFVPPSIV